MCVKQAVTVAPRAAWILALLALLLGVVGSATPAGAWTHGLNRVQSKEKDDKMGTGYGLGWVMLSYKTNGPAVGYLFADGFAFPGGSIKRGSERMDIRGTLDYQGRPDIHRWPWGYAFGSFDGCAYAYGTGKFTKIRKRHATGRCAKGPRRGPRHNWWSSERVAFCTTHRKDKMCSPAGVWSDGKPDDDSRPLKARSLGCTVYANIGAAAVYGKGAPKPRNPLGKVEPTRGMEINVRYVTKDRKYVMAKWRHHPLAAIKGKKGLMWAFFPRSCLTLKPISPANDDPGTANPNTGQPRIAAAVPSCRDFWRHSGHTTRVRWYHCHRTSSPYVKRVHICGRSGTLHGVTVAQFPGNAWLRRNHRHDPHGERC